MHRGIREAQTSSAVTHHLPSEQWMTAPMLALAHDVFQRYVALEPSLRDCLSVIGMTRAASDFGVNLAENEVRDIIVQLIQAPTTGQITVDFATFCHFISMSLGERSPAVDCRSVFDIIDADRDGVLGAKDLNAGFQRYAPEHLQHLVPEQIAVLLKELDQDADGLVTFDDFRHVSSIH